MFTDREATPSWYRETKIRKQSSDQDQKKSATPRKKTQTELEHKSKFPVPTVLTLLPHI